MNTYLSEKHRQIRKEFEDRGETISAWAMANGFQPSEVYGVLSGRIKGVRGKAHEIAVCLGLKENPNTSAQNQKGG